LIKEETNLNSKYNITIGIPTFRRFESIVKLIDQIKASLVLREKAKVIIINDSGNDYDCIEYDNYFEKSDFSDNLIDCSYIKNEANIGYSRTFLRLFEECDTEYLLVMADDDLLIDDNFIEILDFLEKNKPDIASPQWLRNEKLYRGESITRKVEAEEYKRCCGHAPGVIYNVKKASEFLPLLRERISMNCSAALTYPQVLLCISMMITYDNCWHLSYPIAKEGDALGSGIKDSSGNHYGSFASRLQQAAAFDDFILSFKENDYRNRVLKQSRFSSLSSVIKSDADVRKAISSRFKRKSLLSKLLALLPTSVKGK